MLLDLWLLLCLRASLAGKRHSSSSSISAANSKKPSSVAHVGRHTTGYRKACWDCAQQSDGVRLMRSCSKETEGRDSAHGKHVLNLYRQTCSAAAGAAAAS